MSEDTKGRKLSIDDKSEEQAGLEQVTGKAAREAEKARQAELHELPAAKLLEAGRMIPMKQLIESKKNHRRAFGDLDGLGASMLKQGQLTSAWVVAVNPNTYEVIAGARRLRAAKKVGIDELKCDVYDATPEQAAEMRVIENAQREDLKPVEEAENCEELQQLGYTPATIAKKLGKSVGWVHGRLKLLNLGAPARTLLFSEALPGSVALVLGRFPQANQVTALAAMERNTSYPLILARRDNGNPAHWKDADNEKVGLVCNARRAIEFLQEEFMKSLKGAPFDVEDPSLNPEKGACTGCADNTDNQPVAEGEERPKHPFCCNLPCHKIKSEAAWKLTTAKAEEKGAEVLGVAESKEALNGIDYRASSRFVKASAICTNDPKQRTYGQLVADLDKDAQPAVVLAQDDEKKPVKLFERALAEKAFAEAGHKWADRKQQQQAKKSTPSPAKVKEQKEKSARTVRVGLEALKLIVESARKKTNLGDMRAMVLNQLEDDYGHEELRTALEEQSEGDGIATLFGVKPATFGGLKAWVEKKAKLNDLLALGYVLEVGNDYAAGLGGFSAEVKDAATRHKVDLKRLEQLDEQAHAPKPVEPKKEAA